MEEKLRLYNHELHVNRDDFLNLFRKSNQQYSSLLSIQLKVDLDEQYVYLRLM